MNEHGTTYERNGHNLSYIDPPTRGPAMTIPTPPDTDPGPPTRAPRRKSRAPWLILAGLILLGVLGLIVIVAAAPSPPSTGRPVQQYDPGVPTVTGTEPTDEATAAPAAPSRPKLSDIKLTAKITDKECFGSAGCNVEFKVRMAYSGPALDHDDTWEITYEVTGVEDGPLIGTFELTGDQYEVNEELVSTTSSKKKIAIAVTDVEKVGI
jgi:hypothetical protein